MLLSNYARSFASSRRATAALVALGGVILLTGPVSAQDLFVTSDATIANNNPINATYDLVDVGEDAFFTPFPNVTADITTGAVINNLVGVNNATINVHDGSINEADLYDSAIHVLGVDNATYGSSSFIYGSSSLISVTGYGSVGDIYAVSGSSVTIADNATVYSASISASSSLLVSGGTIAYIEVDGTATVNGGNFTDTLSSIDTYASGSVTVNGGTFATGFRVFDSSTVTVNSAIAGDLSATLSGTVGDFDGSNMLLASSYTLTGTLSGGETINTSVLFAGGVTGDGSSLTFSGTASAPVAPDLYVTVDGDATPGIYNHTYIGISQDNTVSNSPTVTLGEGLQTGHVDTYNASTVDVVDTGMVPGTITAHDSSTVNLQYFGGSDTTEVFALDNSTINVWDGPFGNLDNSITGYNNSQVNIYGGDIGGLFLYDSTQGYMNSGYVDFVGIANDAHLTLDGGTVYDLFVADNATVTVNDVVVDNQIVAFGSGSVNLLGGSVYSITTDENAQVTLDQTVDVEYIDAFGSSSVTVNDGLIFGVLDMYDSSSLTVNEGYLSTIFAEDNSNVTINGGTIDEMVVLDSAHVTVTNTSDTLLYLSAFDTATVNISGGAFGVLTAYNQSVFNITGGTFDELVGMGGYFNVTGGIISSNTIYNLRGNTGAASLVKLFGSDFTLSSGVLSSYFDGSTTWDGVLWHLTGTLANNDVLDTFYFEANGSLEGAKYTLGTNSITLSGVSTPEPGSIVLLLATGIPIIGVARRRHRIG